MSSFYDLASLVVVPSGYQSGKIYAQKPLSTDGELTFTRASSATRVGPDGLIQRVRTNVATYSQDFTNWTKSNVTITTSATANPLDGSLDSQDITPTTTLGVHRVLKTNSGGLNSINTWSVYAKAKGYNFLFLVENGNTGSNVSFNLSTGEVGQENSAVGQIESLGSGWYRCSMIVTTTSGPRFDIYVSPTDSLSAYTADGTSGVTLFGAQAEVSDFGPTPYIATTSAAVSVGPVANVPRLDYSGQTFGQSSVCPSLLLEPQRTQLLHDDTPRNITTGTATNRWIMGANSPAVLNQAIGIFGTNSATKYTKTSGATANDFLYYQKANVTNGSVYTLSGYIKLGTASNAVIVVNNAVAWNTGGTFVATAANGYSEWKRFSITFTAPSTVINVHIGYHQETGLDAQATGTFFVEGFQLELGSYETSLIPSLGSAVTRLADSASKTGISSLIGQTEGTLFAEFNGYENTGDEGNRIIAVGDGTSSTRILIFDSNTNIRFFMASGGTQVDYTSSVIAEGNHKVAIGYANNDVAMYIDGVQVSTDTNATIPACPNLYVGTREDGSVSPGVLAGSIKQALLFKTRLTNAQLAELTTL